MLVRLSKNSFVRFFNGEAYITNQLTRYDRTYNETGIDFLSQINRTPRKIDDCIDSLKNLYGDSVSLKELRSDFLFFVKDLANHLFLITGESSAELDSKDIDFSYSLDNPKTLIEDFTQETIQKVTECTQDHNLGSVQGRPHLLGIQFELTSRCNERCIHCYIPNGKKNAGKDMPLDKVFSIIDDFASMGGLHITLSGGEVFMHKDIIEIIQYCRMRDMQVSILSNLIALKDNQIPEIKEANISILQTSLYSMDPSIHDLITTVPGSFIRTKQAIEKLVAADIPLQISCPVMKANYKGYADVLNYARSLKCKAQTDYLMMAQSDLDTSNLANRLNIVETEELLKDIISWDYDYREDTLKHRPISDDIKFNLERFANQPLCGAGVNDCCITENGDVYPCAGWQAMVCGNVYKSSLKEIWENSYELNEIRKIKQKDFPQCLKCDARNFCAMCLVRNYNESGGDMFKLNQHFCDAAFLNKKVVEEYISNNFMSNITDNYSLTYEAIIRRAYQCNRGDMPGADADIYRHLLESYSELMESIDSNTNIKAAKSKFEQQCFLVCGYIRKAVEKMSVNNPNLIVVNKLLPQTTIHGINIIIDKVNELTK